MLLYYPKQCEDCGTKEIMLAIDQKMSKEIQKEWSMRKFLADTKFCKKTFKNLIRYKRIAEKLHYYPEYLGEIEFSHFISKVKIIVK